ncbi:aminotransferase-like domain-containing protein [Pectinatus sottacetonis]|uniref:aminotransferase-like domain-containing protein n=1 Tax=Pectinatus sottacetonis TaxID=1002795 RepID=UPI0018C70BF5|nr:PLP-dependent aminotransferase family protein [Pectinatus sottacetonis]
MSINSFADYPMSWQPVIEKKGVIYRNLAQQLETDIKTGVLLPGTKMPPQRELADFLDINLSTITKAFKICILKGLLSTCIGSGTYVSYDALSNMYLLPDTRGKKVISLGATRPDKESYEQINIQLQKMLKEADYAKWFDYGNTDEMYWHRKAGVLLIEKEGFKTCVNNVFLTSGGQNALMAALFSICKHGDRIGADPETYPGLKTAAGMLGIQIVSIRHDKNDEMDERSLIYACEHDNIKALYVMPQYQNPTAHNMTEKIRRKIAAIAQTYKIYIIEDATYNLSITKKSVPIAKLLPEQTFFIAGLSKALAPGLRLAYISVPENNREHIRNALYNMIVTVSPLMSELAARMIVSGQMKKIVEQHQKENNYRNKIVDEILSDFDCRGDKNCLFRWLLLPSSITGKQLEGMALKAGVQVFAAERFAVGKSRPTRAVRISVCAPQSIEDLKKGLFILRDMLNNCMPYK